MVSREFKNILILKYIKFPFKFDNSTRLTLDLLRSSFI